jgi:hypothetical protein
MEQGAVYANAGSVAGRVQPNQVSQVPVELLDFNSSNFRRFPFLFFA